MIHRLAINLKSIRKERWRMSQDRFAQLFDSSRSKINSYENGGVEPSIAFILRLQQLTKIAAFDLFYGTLNIDQIPPFPLEVGQFYVEDIEKRENEKSDLEKLLAYQKQTHELLLKLDQKIQSIQDQVLEKN